MAFLLVPVLLAGCRGVGKRPFPTPSPLALGNTPSVTPPASPQVPVHVVMVYLSYDSNAPYGRESEFGSTIRVVATFEPTLFTRLPNSLVYEQWTDHNVAEMRACFSLGTPCDPTGPWQPFRTEQGASFTVDWLGSRPVWVAAQFRDTVGQAVPGLGSGGDAPGSLVQVSNEIVGIVNPATPMGQQPPFVQTAVAATRVAFPVEGSVAIEAGRCCAGGVAGEEISFEVAFEGHSAYGPVTQMRIGRATDCTSRQAEALSEMDGLPWEPFVPTRAFTTTLAINWVGWYISVQYRDEGGHLSQVYCDDISLEGMPAQPVGTPAP